MDAGTEIERALTAAPLVVGMFLSVMSFVLTAVFKALGQRDDMGLDTLSCGVDLLMGSVVASVVGFTDPKLAKQPTALVLFLFACLTLTSSFALLGRQFGARLKEKTDRKMAIFVLIFIGNLVGMASITGVVVLKGGL